MANGAELGFYFDSWPIESALIATLLFLKVISERISIQWRSPLMYVFIIIIKEM